MESIVLKNVRFDWVDTLWTAKRFAARDEPKHSVTVILPKDHPQAKEFCEAMQRIADTAFPLSKRSKKDEINIPPRDGDDPKEEKGEAYKGCWFMNVTATTEYPPQVVDGAKNKVEKAGVWTSGDYGNIVLTLGSYSVGDNKGSTAYIDAVQFVRKGERLGRDVLGRFEVEQGEEIGQDDDNNY